MTGDFGYGYPSTMMNDVLECVTKLQSEIRNCK